jgi:alkylation response protein AidB-like acyl-CoA dehydrogenase
MEGNVVEAVRSIRPSIAEHRVWASENARMAPAVVEATRKAGLYTLLAPREMGGADATFPEIMEVLLELGYADPTVGWHVVNSTMLIAALVSVAEDLRGPIFDDPPGPYGFAGSPNDAKATPVDGGFRLTGTWPFMTGSMDAPWSLLRGFVAEGDGLRQYNDKPAVYRFILPASDYEIHRTWGAASAMRGTGSHGVSADDVFVPEGLAIPLFGGPEPLLKGHATRLPQGASMLVPCAALAVGLVQRMLEEVTGIAMEKSFGGVPYREMPDRHFGIANGNAAVAGLRATLLDMAQEVESSLGENPGDVPETTRARMWATMYWVLDQSRVIASDLAALSTSSFYANQNPIEMALRDIQATCATLGDARSIFGAAAGRVYLGLEPGTPMF